MSGNNPFDDPDGRYLVLVNHEGQHSLWPDFADVPPGWRIAHHGDRPSCLDYVETHWTDMRPTSLVDAVAQDERAGRGGFRASARAAGNT